MGTNLLMISATFLLLSSSLMDEWVLFVDPEGQFEVKMPEGIDEASRTVATPIGDLKYISLSSKEMFDDQVVQYNLNFCDYPEGTFHKDSIELIRLFLNETITASVESVGGTLIYQDETRNRKEIGAIWKVTSEQHNLQFKNMAVIDGDRFYSLKVIIPPEKSLDNNADEFFDSFRLTNK
jgi:hypothetical protein